MLPALAIAFVLGVLLGVSHPAPPWALAASAAVAVLVAYAGRRARARSWVVPLAIAAFLGGAGAAPHPTYDVAPRGLARVDARVERTTADGAFVRVESAELLDAPERLRGDARIFVRELDAPDGARIRALMNLQPVTAFRNPSPHPDWMRGQSVQATARLRGDARVVSSGWLSEALHDARTDLRRRLDATLSPRGAGMARALLLGEGGAVPDDDAEAFRGAGLAHLLAVSGLHVGLVVAMALLFIRRVCRGRVRDAERAAALGAIPIAIGFAAMAGGAPSAWRAALTAALALGCRALRRRPRATGVAAAAIGMLALTDPTQVVRPAFLLSVAATASILTADLAGDPLRVAARVSWRTTVATAPLVIWCFGSLPPLSVLANVVVVPIAVLALVPLAFLHALMSGLGFGAVALPFELTCDGLVGLGEVFAVGPPLPPPSLAQGWVLCAFALSLLAARRKRWRLLAVAVGIAALGACELHLRWTEQPTGLVRATYVDVGQGDAALLDMPDGRLVLIDAGGGRPDPGARSLLPLLRARRRSVIDLAIITHPHPDHYGGLLAVSESVTVREVWHSGQGTAESPHGQEAALLRSLRRRGARVRSAEEVCGRVRRFGEAEVEVMWPCRPGFDAGFDPNDNSIVARITFGARRFLFTGDVEALAEAELSHEPRVRADVLKVPHHGSRTSSSEGFLAAVRPAIAVASCGRRNSFGHPHPEVVARYDAAQVPLLRTDREGGVVVTTDGVLLHAETFGGRALQIRARIAKAPAISQSSP